MNIFFEESGSLKAGAVLLRQGQAAQIELPSARRIKVKARDILFEFESPGARELLEAARRIAQELDPDFLWACAPVETFHFLAFADEYFGAPAPAAARAAMAFKLQDAPVYFRRKGKGHYHRAPEHQLKAALAAIEYRRQQAEVQADYEAALSARQLPPAFKDKVLTLLTQPDKQTVEYKALEATSAALGLSAAQLMLDCGGIASARILHEARFYNEYFPEGIDFPEDMASYSLGAALDLPCADCEAFSIDDISTTEIDDAFSVRFLADDRLCVGIHIAVPGLGIARDDAIDEAARARFSTVYMPGGKITMLPSAVIDVFTLKEGLRPALSLYLIVDRATQQVIATETRVEQVRITRNHRYHQLDAQINENTLFSEENDYPNRREIAVLWPFAQALHKKRQQARLNYGLKHETTNHTDFNFYIEGERVRIVPRVRTLIDLIVAELAIFANSCWGGLLAEYGAPGIYRVQRAPRVTRTQMDITPAPHEGLGVAQYAWSTSPLRRYVDLVNQWQLLACIQHGGQAHTLPFAPKDTTLFQIAQDFTQTYSAYRDYQNRMERFWCLRWLKQEAPSRVAATVVKDGLARLNDIPLWLQVPNLSSPTYACGSKVLLDILAIDELNLSASCRIVQG